MPARSKPPTVGVTQHHKLTIPTGYPNRTYTQQLIRLIKANAWTFGVEIGVYEGANIIALLRACPELRMIAVFTPRDEPEPKVRVALEQQFPGRVSFRSGQSIEIADRVADASLDFVFIDGSHLTSAVRGDIIAWRPKVKTGGALVGHNVQLSSVQEALLDVLGAWDQIGDDLWIWRV
jgi:predicted O-methyltransferase YrrM